MANRDSPAHRRHTFLLDRGSAWLRIALGVSLLAIGAVGLLFSLQMHGSATIFIRLALISMVAAGAMCLRDGFLERRAVTYVPPVIDQIAQMPAEEILVRGSSEPAPADELLRGYGSYEARETLTASE